MASVNKAILVGNLGQDPELKFTSDKTAIANFSIATTNNYKKGEEWVKETEWHRITAFGRTAENCAQYLRKGSSVFIEGRIKQDSWEDKKTGEKRYSTSIVAHTIQFLDSKPVAETKANSDFKAQNTTSLDDIPF